MKFYWNHVEIYVKGAFQALTALEYDGDIVEACRYVYLHDKDGRRCKC